MLDFLRGIVVSKDAEGVVLDTGAFGMRLLVPAYVEVGNPLVVGEEALLYVLLSATLDRPGPNPFTLVGFRTSHQREFFEEFSTVSGIGTRGAVKALAGPMEAIANAIERGEAKYLQTLPGVGPGKAKKIIAELQGKMVPFATAGARGLDSAGGSGASAVGVARAVAATGLLGEVQVALEALGYSPGETRDLINRVLTRHPEVGSAEEFLRLVFVA